MKVISGLVCVCLLLPAVQAQLSIPCVEGFSIARVSELLREKSPSMECTSQILAIIGVRDYVAEAPTVFRALAVICEPACLEFARTVALECVPAYVGTLGLACGKNERASFCYQTVAMNNGSSLLAQCPELLTLPQATTPGAIAENTTDEPDTNSTTELPPAPTQPPSMCSDVCRGALMNFRATHGCCVSNAFNTSAFGLEMFNFANYGFWSACRVETVTGSCSSPFVDDSTDSGYVLAACGVLSLLGVLLAFFMIV